MRPKAICTFHGIGQGLFYSGTIHSNPDFTFVYDCGTARKSDQKILETEIDRLFDHGSPQKDTIDALFISHFDLDHISGVPYLLDRYRVKNVFIPYFTPEVMKLIALKNADAMADEGLRALYEDPISFFTVRECKQVVVLHPSSNEIQGEGPDDGNDSFTYDGNVRKETGTRYSCYGQGQFRFHGCDWVFQIYQDQTKEEQEKLRDRIHALIPNDAELSALLTDKALIKEAKKEYKSVKYGINQSSMVLYHAPSDSSKNLQLLNPYPICPDCRYYGWDSGTLLTGDLNLRKLQQKGSLFTKFVLEKPHRLGIFQLPHHGSGRSISINQIVNAVPDGRAMFVCSYGRNNRYGHPDPYSLDKVMQCCGGMVIHVVEKQSYTYKIGVD